MNEKIGSITMKKELLGLFNLNDLINNLKEKRSIDEDFDLIDSLKSKLPIDKDLLIAILNLKDFNVEKKFAEILKENGYPLEVMSSEIDKCANAMVIFYENQKDFAAFTRYIKIKHNILYENTGGLKPISEDNITEQELNFIKKFQQVDLLSIDLLVQIFEFEHSFVQRHFIRTIKEQPSLIPDRISRDNIEQNKLIYSLVQSMWMFNEYPMSFELFEGYEEVKDELYQYYHSQRLNLCINNNVIDNKIEQKSFDFDNNNFTEQVVECIRTDRFVSNDVLKKILYDDINRQEIVEVLKKIDYKLNFSG